MLKKKKKNPERQVFYPQFIQESFKAQSSKTVVASRGLVRLGCASQGCSFSARRLGHFRGISSMIQGLSTALPPQEWLLSLRLGTDNFLLCP